MKTFKNKRVQFTRYRIRNLYNSSLSSIGENADLIILVRYSNDSEQDDEENGLNSTVFAKPSIIQECSDGRPEVGTVVLYKEYGLTQGNKEEYLKFLFLHEFTHILGFLPKYLNKLKVLKGK